MDAGDITKMVEAKLKDFQPLYSRMDRDFDSWRLVKSDYDTTIDKKTKKHGSEIEIISNDPRTNCDDVQSILSASEQQIIVRMAEPTGDDKRTEIGKLERLFVFLLRKADERLIRLLLPPLKESLIWYSLVRGWTAGRFLTYGDKNKDVIADYMALDPRWLTYEVGKDGLLWTGYTTFRSKESIEGEYKVEIKDMSWYKPWGGSTQNIPVIDYWKDEGGESKWNSVVSLGKFLKKPVEYKLRSMPVLIMPISTRPPVVVKSGDGIEGYGDSIFAPTRDINGVRNRVLSMVFNHANIKANQPMINYRSKHGKPIPAEALFNVPGSIIELVLNENKLEPSPMLEIPDTIVEMLSWLNNSVQKGQLPDLSIGSPPQSGTLQGIVQERGDKIFNPQLRNLNYFYEGICRLIEEQILAGGVGETRITKVDIEFEEDRKYKKIKITPVDLKKPHIIKVEHTARSPYNQMEVLQQALMLQQLGFPDGWIRENILKVQDPKGLADLAAIELFEKSPKGAMKRAAEALIETRGDIEGALSLVRDLDRMESEEQNETDRVTAPLPPQGSV